MSYPDHIDPIERKIIDCLITTALAEGFSIAVYGDGELDLPFSKDYEAITREINACSMTELILNPGKHWVMLVHGNGCEVICDYTTKSEAIFAKATELADAIYHS